MSKDRQISNESDLMAVLSDISFGRSVFNFKWKFEVEPIINVGGLSEGKPSVLRTPELYGWFVNLAFERPDTNTGIVGWGRGRKELVQVGAWESGVVKTCWVLFNLLVTHELMEAYEWRGKRIFNPHNSVYDLASIQE